MNTRRLLLSPLVLLIALAAILGLNASSAAAGGGLETRVRAIDHITVDAVGQPSSETAGGVGCLRPSQPAIVSGSCVAAMFRTGEVQVGGGGTTYVANPASETAFTPNRFPSVYAEFDVPTGSLRPAGAPGWSQIPSPDSLLGRLFTKQGGSLQSPVPACNIVVVASRASC